MYRSDCRTYLWAEAEFQQPPEKAGIVNVGRSVRAGVKQGEPCGIAPSAYERLSSEPFISRCCFS